MKNKISLLLLLLFSVCSHAQVSTEMLVLRPVPQVVDIGTGTAMNDITAVYNYPSNQGYPFYYGTNWRCSGGVTTITVPYTSSNGGSYTARSYSAGGATLTLQAGTLNPEGGNLVFAISGTAAQYPAGFPVNTGNFNFTLFGETFTAEVWVYPRLGGGAVTGCPQ